MSILPAIVTPTLLASLRSYPHLPGNTWYLLVATTLAQLNRPDEIPKVYQHALRYAQDQEEKLRITRRTREALIKAAPVGGVPKVPQVAEMPVSLRTLPG
jgi:hypothetical protein